MGKHKKEWLASYMRARRAKRKRLGICLRCPNPSGGKTYCPQCRAKIRARQLEKKNGLTQERYEATVQKQNGCCAICHKPTKNLYIDHCHKTGKFRALLCNLCNTGLGMFFESVEIMSSAIRYVQRYDPAVTAVWEDRG